MSMRVVRYVYHTHGHAKLHDPSPATHDHTGLPNGPVVPFEVVLRLTFAIDSDNAMDKVRKEVRDHIVAELKAQDSPYIVGDVMIRGVSMLHRILVESDDPMGPAVSILP